jgi:hypothetical protein
LLPAGWCEKNFFMSDWFNRNKLSIYELGSNYDAINDQCKVIYVTLIIN